MAKKRVKPRGKARRGPKAHPVVIEPTVLPSCLSASKPDIRPISPPALGPPSSPPSLSPVLRIGFDKVVVPSTAANTPPPGIDQRHVPYPSSIFAHYSDEIAKAREDTIKDQIASAEGAVPLVWVQKGLVQQYSVKVVNCYLRSTHLRYLSHHYPHVRLVADRVQFHYDHPLLRIERQWAEDAAIAYINRLASKYSVVPDLATKTLVVDIGGNPNRHHHAHRPIHSCNPVFSSTDAFRKYQAPAGALTCSHLVEKCTCVTPIAYLSVHSLYYFSPDVISQLVSRTVLKVAVCVVHEFRDAYGSFCEGEAVYHMVSPTTVSMSVTGASSAYVHSNLGWLKAGSFMTQDGSKLVWTKVSTFGSNSVYCFTLTSDRVLDEHPVVYDLRPAVEDDNYYGDVSLSSVESSALGTTAGDVIHIPDCRLYSWGSFLFIYKRTQKVNLMCPKKLVSVVAAWVMGKPRSPGTFQSCLTHFRFQARSYNIPTEACGQAVFAACVLGFVQNLEFETGMMHSVIKPCQKVIDVHSKALTQTYSGVWTENQVLAMGVAAGVGGIATVAASSILGGPVAGAVTAAALVGSAAIGAVVTAVGYNTDHVQQTAESIFRAYGSRAESHRTNNEAQTVVVPLPKKFSLPSTIPNQTVEQLCNRAVLDSTAVLDISACDSTANHDEVRKNDPLVASAIVSSMGTPVVPARSFISELAATTTRVLKKGPIDTGCVSQVYLDKFETWLFTPATLARLGFEQNSVRPMRFDDWNSNYPLSQQETHRRALSEFISGTSSRPKADQRSLFVKIESLAKSTMEDLNISSKLCPRAIQSGTSEHNVVTGPFFKALSKHVAAVWNVVNKKGPMYTSGASAEDIGSTIHYMTTEHQFHMEGDFDRFDSTIHRRLLIIAARLYQFLGADAVVIATCLNGISTFGRTKLGIKYSVDGGRKSGDHDTSIGNTLIQCCAMMFCYCEALECGVDALIENHQFSMVALGDDNYVSGSRSLEVVDIKSRLLALGLELSPVFYPPDVAPHMVTFCSSIVLPCLHPDGSQAHVLSTPIGRGIAKGGWSVDPTVPVDSLARASAIANSTTMAHVPFLRMLWKRVMELTRGVEAAPTDKSTLHKAKVSVAHECDAMTWHYVEQRYGLTPQHEAEYAALLASVTSLPCVVDYAPLKAAMVVDGIDVSYDVPNAPFSHVTTLFLPDLTSNCETCSRPTTSGIRDCCSCPGHYRRIFVPVASLERAVDGSYITSESSLIGPHL